MDVWLACKVSLGQFRAEYAIIGEEFNGTGFSAFVPTEFVQCDERPAHGKLVSGFLRVQVLEEDRDLRLVQLPRQTLDNGQIMTVREDQLQDGPSPVEAAADDSVRC